MHNRVILLAGFVVIFGLAACSFPAGLTPPTGSQSGATQNQSEPIAQTQAAASPTVGTPTLEGTQAAGSGTPRPAVERTPGQNDSAVTPSPVGTEKGGGRCDLAQAGRPIDITVPDDTRLYPGQYFSKTWRLVNAGTCTWTNEYAIVWFSGSDLGVVRSQSFNTQVLPGNSIDVSIEMAAPMLPGTYQSNWKLRNAQGQLFGIGPNGDAPFWARVVVVALNTPTVTPLPPTATPTPEIVASGFSALKLGESFDLDTGQFTQLESHDLLFGLLDDEAAHLIPQNGARLVYYGASLPSIEECRLAPVAEFAIRFDSLQTATYLCYRTSQGLPGRIYLATVDAQNNLLNLEYVTWALP